MGALKNNVAGMFPRVWRMCTIISIIAIDKSNNNIVHSHASVFVS